MSHTTEYISKQLVSCLHLQNAPEQKILNVTKIKGKPNLKCTTSTVSVRVELDAEDRVYCAENKAALGAVVKCSL